MTAGPARLRAVLFDFDFTLGDSSRGIIDCVNTALAAIGRPPAGADAIRRRIGLTLPEVVRALHPACTTDELDTFVCTFHARADQIMADATELYTHTIPLLLRLRARDIRTGIVSTKFGHRIRSILKRHDALNLVDTIVGLEDVVEHKPDPEGLLLALQRLEVSSACVLYVGDHEVDFEAARAAGVSFVGILTGMSTAACFKRWGSACTADLVSLEGILFDVVPGSAPKAYSSAGASVRHAAPHSGHAVQPSGSRGRPSSKYPHDGQ